jgi:hypothetical protein
LDYVPARNIDIVLRIFKDSWRHDPEFEKALAALHQVDESLWR